MVGTADTVLIREVSLIQCVLYREIPLYFACHRLHQAHVQSLLGCIAGMAAIRRYSCVSLQVNPEIVPELEKHGLRFVGQDETQKRMEIMELPGEGGMG